MKQLFSFFCLLSLPAISYCQFPDANTIKKNKIRIISLSGESGTDHQLYDENGWPVKGAYEDTTFKNPGWTNKMFYNENSMPDSIYSTGHSNSKTYFKYAPDGSYTKIEIEKTSSDTSFYTKDNKIKERRKSNGSITKYEYNAKRQLIKEIETSGKNTSITIYVYNAAGQIQSEKTTGGDTRSYFYLYGKKGLLVKQITDYGSGSKFTTSYFYKFK